MIERIREEIADMSDGVTPVFVATATAMTLFAIAIGLAVVMAVILEPWVLAMIGGVAFIALFWYVIVKWAQNG